MPKASAPPPVEPAPLLEVGVAQPAFAHPEDVRGWYLPAKHLPNLFTPLAVLQTLSQLADGDARVTMAAASQEVPAGILQAMVRMLSLLGYVQTDGIVITIVKLPVKT